MQKRVDDFNKETDLWFNAIGVSTALAEKILTDGGIYVHNRDTDYRGDVLIVDADTNTALGFVELDACPINEMEPPSFSWHLVNPRRIVEIPCISKEGIFSVVFEKGDIVAYPTEVELDDKGVELAQEKLNALH